MKHIQKIRLFIPCFAIIMFGLSTPVIASQDSGLELVHSEFDRAWYVNTATMVSPAPGMISFWNKIVPTKGGEYYSQMGTLLEKAGKNPDRLEYVQALQELDCTTNRSKIWSVIFYDKQDRIVFSGSVGKATTKSIAFESAADEVRKTVCDPGSREKEEHKYILQSSLANEVVR
jgi:hypothetical protein